MRPDNRLVSALVRSRAHRLLSGTVILLRYRGRRSGRVYTIPLQYAERDGELVLFAMNAVRKQWWRNVTGDAEVEVLLRGRWWRATARLALGDAEAARRYAARFRSARRLLAREQRPVFVVVTPVSPLSGST